ncbi:MAG TPA: hypothetical protein VG841_07185 [Caulobacterales bacterium]|nr:hypothetical protein [Caulobacterales bacterium]
MRRSTFLLGALGCGLAPSALAAAPAAVDQPLNRGNTSNDVARIWGRAGNRKLLIILPPYGGDHHYFDASTMPAHLLDRGVDFAVLFTEVTGYNTTADVTRLDTLIRHVMEHRGYDRNKIVLGGFSAGGSGAFRYALRKLQGENLAIQPAALISVDAPLDLERWYKGMSLVLQRSNESNPFFGECQYLTGMYREMFHGAPEENPQAYWDNSILTASKPDGGNAAYFKRTPMRLYSEPDMDFFLPYAMDYGSINASDQVSMAAISKAQGNENVSLVLTSGRGYRADLNNMRLPHSWSIVDEPALAEWVAARLV